MGHHKQTMKNESGVVQLFSLWEQLQAGVRTFGDNHFVCVCISLCTVSKRKVGNKCNELCFLCGVCEINPFCLKQEQVFGQSNL